jgi:hypothetical protein
MSAAKSMSISLRRKRGALFEARNATGQTTLIDGPPDLGGQGEGVRPMEAVLIALQHGAELGLPKMASLQNIAVINGKPSVYGDALMALVQSEIRVASVSITWRNAAAMHNPASSQRYAELYTDVSVT